MKINTKATDSTTPIKGYSHSFYHENKYIPSASARDFEYKEKDETEQQGRTVKYETIIVTTPILTSARVNKAQNSSNNPSKVTQRLLFNKDEVDEISTKLNALYLHDTDDCPMRSTSKLDGGKSEMKPQDPPEAATFLGRCSLVIYNASTRGFMEVIRSARLAFPKSYSY